MVAKAKVAKEKQQAKMVQSKRVKTDFIWPFHYISACMEK